MIQQNNLNITAEVQNYIEVGERPWGKYYVLEVKDGYKVKRIEVNSGHRLSLQSHKFRSEHWIVAKGVATVETQIPDRSEQIKVEKLIVGQNCFIPSTFWHRLSNTGTEVLVIIEVQIGDYTEEDDIARIEDDYSRV
jgi:mannose-6-phosphate isomerase-like protein (cupin superfamily)